MTDFYGAYTETYNASKKGKGEVTIIWDDDGDGDFSDEFNFYTGVIAADAKTGTYAIGGKTKYVEAYFDVDGMQFTDDPFTV